MFNFDDELMEKYLEGEEVSTILLKELFVKVPICHLPILAVVLNLTLGKLAPDSVVDYTPAPTDVEAIECN